MQNNNQQSAGFTIMEFIVVVTLMALLTTAVVAITLNIRIKTRDTRRVAIATQLQSALASYYRDTGSYPITNVVEPGNPFASTDIVYLAEMPHNPNPQDDGDCAEDDFSYEQNNGGVSYSFTFCLGLDSGDLSAGTRVMTPAGFY